MDELKTLLAKAAPWLAAAATGPAGLAAQAIKTVASALGRDAAADAGDLATALAGANPEQLQALRAAELDFKVRMQTLGIESLQRMEQLAVDDRKDARAMQVATRSKIPGALAVLIVLGFFGVLVGMLTGGLKTEDSQALLVLLGALSAGFGAVLNYYFGSSAGSARKDEISALSKANAR